MKPKNLLRVVLLFLGGSLANSASGLDDDGNEVQLRKSFTEFPVLALATNDLGKPLFQPLSLTNPIVIGSDKYFGFRFTVPPRKAREDLAWAFVAPADYFRWSILQEKGTMTEFTEWTRWQKRNYLSTSPLLPLNRDGLILQSLPGDALVDGQTYLIWFDFDGKATAMSVAYTFAQLGVEGMNQKEPIARALGLDRPSSPPVVNPANHHVYILLKPGTWRESEAQAVTMGGHLATVRNQDENDWLVKTFGNYGGTQRLLWIGLSDTEKKFHFAWSSGESVSYTAWAKGEPNNAGRGEDMVAIYYPNHSQAGRWNDWSDTNHDPIGLPMCGVVEIIPPELTVAQPAVTRPSAGSQISAAELQAVMITPALVITNDGGSIKLQWPVATAHHQLEVTTNLAQPFTMFGYSEVTNLQSGMVSVIITNPVPQMFFRFH